MAPLLLWATVQFEPHLRRCYNMPEGKMMCTCANTLVFYTQGEPRNPQEHPKFRDLSPIEDSARDSYEMALKGEWEPASHQVATLASAVCGLESDFEGEQWYLSELDTRTARLMAEVRAQAQASTMEEANEITRVLLELGTKINPPVPLALDMLDYYGRKLEVGILRKDVSLLQRTVEEMRRSWDEIRPSLRVTAERGEAMRFDAILRRLEHARGLADYPQLVQVERGVEQKLQKAGREVIPAAETQEKRISRHELPPAVEKTVAEQSQGAAIHEFSTEVENGKTLYEAELTVHGHRRSISMDEKGGIVEVEEEVAMESLPPVVKEGIGKAVGAGTIRKVESLTKNGKLVAYEAAVKRGTKRWEIQVGPDGHRLAHPE